MGQNDHVYLSKKNDKLLRGEGVKSSCHNFLVSNYQLYSYNMVRGSWGIFRQINFSSSKGGINEKKVQSNALGDLAGSPKSLRTLLLSFDMFSSLN